MSEMIYRPSSVAELTDVVLAAASEGRPIEIRGGGTKAGIGRPVQADATLDVRGLSGITLYEPAEMVIAAYAGTPLAELEAALTAKGQMLPFEPPSWTEIVGAAGSPTVGGMVAAGVSGPRRLTAGACRDSVIGVKLVNGRGDLVTSGGRVMKNVTGYDLTKVQTGAWGTLGVLIEVTFKVLPRPASSATLIWDGLGEARAVQLLCAAMGTPFEVSGAAHVPEAADRPAMTCLRLEHFPESLTYRTRELADALSAYGAPRVLDEAESQSLWVAVGSVDALAAPAENALWRVSTAPTRAAALVAAVRSAMPVRALYDWSGGLVWLSVPANGDAGASTIRAAVGSAGGHATLMRCPDAVRGAIEPFHPPAEPVMRLSKALKHVFDPAGVLNPGRMYAGV